VVLPKRDIVLKGEAQANDLGRMIASQLRPSIGVVDGVGE
jgi:hypothetical protein